MLTVASIMIKVLIVALIPVVFGQEIIPQLCENFVQETKQNFNAEAYLGKWYEIARYDTVFQKDGECATATYSLRPDGKIGVVNTMLYLPSRDKSEIEGYAVEKTPGANDGKLLVTFPSSPLGNYWVVDTDYKNYSVVWSCFNVQNGSIQFLWILSRGNTLTAETQATVDAVLTKNNLNKERLRTTVTNEEKCGKY